MSTTPCNATHRPLLFSDAQLHLQNIVLMHFQNRQTFATNIQIPSFYVFTIKQHGV